MPTSKFGSLRICTCLGLMACAPEVDRGQGPHGGGPGGGDSPGEDGSDTGGPDAPGDDGGDGGTGGDADSGSDDGGGGDGAGVKFDVAGGTEGPDPDGQQDECRAIDFLFVIDNSGSMLDEQQQLIASFPGFTQEIMTATDTEDFHVMVVGSDKLSGTDPNPHTCDTVGCCADYCDSWVWAEHICIEMGGTPARCDGGNMNCRGELGDGRHRGAANVDCGFADGQQYIDDTSDLGAAFACAASLGVEGSGNEKPMQAMVNALTEAQNGPMGCNEGFFRKDALLVIVLITDEEDDHETTPVCNVPPQSGSAGQPFEWFNAVVAAADGIEQNVVVLSLIGPTGANACPPLDKCNDGKTGAEPAPRIEQFTNLFSRGSVGPVCAADYQTFFANAVGAIDQACEDFVPPG